MRGLGLRIKPINGNEFDIYIYIYIWGTVTSADFPEDGKVYYCDGQSFPESCVIEVYTTKEKANTDVIGKDIKNG